MTVLDVCDVGIHARPQGTAKVRGAGQWVPTSDGPRHPRPPVAKVRVAPPPAAGLPPRPVHL